LTVDFSDSLARIYATTFLLSPGSDNNKILKIIDTDANATALELSLAGSNYLYKGLDFAPAFPPALPQISQVDHPSCTQSTGKVHLSGLPAGQWRITGNPSGSKTGTGSTAIVENLVAGQSYSFKVTSYTGRSSNFTSAVVVNAQPEIPTVPTGSAIQKRCQGADLTDLSLNQTNVLWYANVNSTIPLNASTSLVHNTHYFAAQLHVNGCESTTRCDVHAKLVNNGVWKGENVGSWKQSSNWCGGVPAFGATVIVPAETIIHLDTMVELSELNIESTANLNLSASKKLSVTGDITLNGDLTLEDKATLVQHTNSGWLGNGNVHVRQAISGTGLTTPNGRYWFVGSPMSNSMSQDYHAETSSVLKYFNEPTGAWVEINNATTPIQVGKGYFVQTGSMDTVEFSGGQLNNGNYTFPCTRTGETNFYRGFNLVSNPYPSYVDFDAVTKTNILPTMWYRTADQAQTMVFDTYNSLTGIGTSVGGEVVTNFIPPMQSFWVKIPTGFTTGEIGFANNMRSHHSTGYEGLKNTGIDYPVFIRMNLLDEGKKDQLIVFMDYHMSALVDEFDCEKMTVTGYPQLYTSVGAAKLVIDALPFSKLRTIVPLTMNLPSSKIYQFQIAESSLENVTLTLEDKQENVLQDLSDNPCYSFYSNNGIINDRFVLHINALFGSTASISNITNDSNEESSLFEPHISQSGLSGEIHIQFMEPISSECYVRIYDMSGKLVHTAKLYESESVLHLTEGTGIYFCEIDNGHNVFRKRIVITN
jgi:hypothetical protein